MKPLTIKQAEDFGCVAVVMGGDAAEKNVSQKSGKAVLTALQQQGVEVIAIDTQDNPIAALSEKRFDRVFNIIHGRGGEDGILQALLESMKIPYTGSGVMASALTMDKLRTKLCWQGSGLETPKWMVLKEQTDIQKCIEKLGFPVMVKPALEGSSLGMNKANNEQELIAAWKEAIPFNCDVFAEKWVKGHEYTVAILNGEALPVIRLETTNEFYDYEAKYELESTGYHCPCGLDLATENQLKTLAKEACAVVGVKGWGRVDLFIDKTDKVQLIEVNTVPGMTDHSLVPMAAKASGIDFKELVWRILETSFSK